jgi:aspartyl-tRNA(Asn)/glutamyl-tRNA(Gln) amidotransferase subunit C
MREDEVVPSLDRERVLANAPDRNDGEFRLPKIVEDA